MLPKLLHYFFLFLMNLYVLLIFFVLHMHLNCRWNSVKSMFIGTELLHQSFPFSDEMWKKKKTIYEALFHHFPNPAVFARSKTHSCKFFCRAYFRSVIGGCLGQRHHVAEPCGPTVVYISALICIPREQLHVEATEQFGQQQAAAVPPPEKHPSSPPPRLLKIHYAAKSSLR